MHIVGKVMSGLGAVILLLCVVIFAFGVSSVSENIEDVNYVISDQNSGYVEVYDDDYNGDIGFTIYVEGVYEDTNNDGAWDICDSVNITAIHDGKYMENFGTNESYAVNASDDERFYFEVGEPNAGCNVGAGETRIVDGKELVKIGRACWGCMNGTLTIESNEPIWVVYDDEEMAELIGGIFAALSSTCLFPCGCCFLILGLILGFTMSEDTTDPVILTGVAYNAPPLPVETGIPMPTNDSAPAHAYYGSMIARGFEPELAEKMTQEQYPGFNQ